MKNKLMLLLPTLLLGQIFANPLHDAVDKCNLEALENALYKYQDQDQLLKDHLAEGNGSIVGLTPLELAVFRNDHDSVIDVVKLLINKNAVCDTFPVITFAMDKGNQKLAELLIEKQQGITIKNSDGDTPLIWAIKNDKTEYIELLAEKLNVNINTIDIDNDPIFKYAIEKGYIALIKLLIKHGACIDDQIHIKNTNAYSDTSRKKNYLMKNLVKFKPTPLEMATLTGQLEVVELLLELGAEPGKIITSQHSFCVVLMCAVYLNHVEIAKKLIKGGALVNTYDQYNNILKTSNYDNNLNIAIKSGHLSMVSVLLDNGADLEYKAKEGLTPLGLTIRCIDIKNDLNKNVSKEDKIGIVKLILDKKPNLLSKEGLDKQTPLELAYETKDSEVINIVSNAFIEFIQNENEKWKNKEKNIN